MGAAHKPSVLLRLNDIILSPGKLPGMSSLLQSICIVDEAEAVGAAAQPAQPNISHLQVSLPDNLDPTPTAGSVSSAKQAFGASSVSLHGGSIASYDKYACSAWRQFCQDTANHYQQ